MWKEWPYQDKVLESSAPGEESKEQEL